MIRIVRSIACLVLAFGSGLIAWIWFQIPHVGNRPGKQVAVTFDAAVGMVDLYLRDEYRGFERLVEVDPALENVGKDAARTVAIDRRFDLDERVNAARILAEREALDEGFNSKLAAVSSDDERSSFCGLDDGLDRRMGCAS